VGAWRSALPAALAGAALLAGCSRGDLRLPDLDRPAAAAPAGCPAGLAGCRSASGRILYVERVDPDGDGDAHFVLASRDSITGPGISVIDVPRGLRPDPLPGPGDRISAAGPVHTGSHRQKQIEAVSLRVEAGRAP
jgi:hypothetical protein